MRIPHNKVAAPPREELERLYVEQGLRLTEVAAHFGVSQTPVIRWLKEYGLGPRTKRDARFVAKKADFSEETLERMRARAAAMREKVTPEDIARGAEKRRGQVPWNKGQPMREETRQKLIEQRADPEYRRRQSEFQLGELSPNWRGGQKAEHNRRLDRAEWRRTRKLVYERDNWTCQDCGRKCKGAADSKNDGRAKIQAHHIVARRDGGTDELGNLTTLCMSCHHRREAEKKPRTPAGRPRFTARA